MVKFAGAVEYISCISPEVQDSPTKCPRYDIE